MDHQPVDYSRPPSLFENELWLRGEISYLLHPMQLDIYRRIFDWKAKNPVRSGPFILNAHRGFGKSFFSILLGLERCIRFPNQEVRCGAPELSQAKEINEPHLKTILSRAPEGMCKKIERVVTVKNPRWNNDSAYSTLRLFGCKEEADAQRGKRSDMIILDECRDIKKFEYIVRSVLNFHFTQRKNPLFLLISTPPNSPDHPWASIFLEEAKRGSGERYIKFPSTENQDWTQEEDDALAEVCGGRDNTAWQREALCEIVAEETMLIVPEYRKVREEIFVQEWDRPSHFRPLVCLDTGWVDHTAVLFGFVDFIKQLLVIEEEIVVNRTNTHDLAAMILEKEKALYPEKYWPIRRFGDITPQQLDDFLREIRIMGGSRYPVSFSPVDKYGSEVAMAGMRSAIQQKRIRITSKCPCLDHQLRVGIQNEKGKFERSEVHGHFDAIAALKYLFRKADFHTNPFPDPVIPDNFFVSPFEKTEKKTPRVTYLPPVVTRRRPF